MMENYCVLVVILLRASTPYAQQPTPNSSVTLTPQSAVDTITTVSLSLPPSTSAVLTDTMTSGTSGVQFTTTTTLQPGFTTGSVASTAAPSSSSTAALSEDVDLRWPLHIVGFFPISRDILHRGSSALLAANLALEHINNKADILPGYQLAMNWNDSFCNAGIATQALFEHINSGTKYHMLLGAGCSSVAQTISLAADLWNIIQVSYSASSPALSVRSQYKTFFRTNAADSQYNNARLAMIKRFNWTRVATLHENQEVFSTSINDFSALLANNGIDLITSESFTVDPEEQVKNLKSKGAWIIFGNFYENMARRVFCHAYREKLYGKHYAWFLPGGYQDKWWEEPDDSVSCSPEEMYKAIKGYISTENIPLSIYKDRITASGYTAREYEAIVDELFAAHENSTSFDANKAAASYAYDATWTIALTLNKSLSNFTNGLKDFHYENKKMREVFMDTLYNLQFEGVSGTVSFTRDGNREGLIEVRQMKDGTEKPIGRYSPQEEELILEGIEWQGGEAPKDETTETNITLYVPHTYVYVAAGFSSVGVTLVLVLALFMAVYRQRSVFGRTMPGYLGVMLFGCILLYGSVVLLGLDSSLVGEENFTIMCKLSSSTLTIGFACAYGVLFAKIYRAHKLLVTKANLWKPDPHGGHMARTMLIFFVVDIATLIVWIVAFPMESTTEIVENRLNEDENTLYNDLVEFCSKGDAVYFIVGLFVFHGLALLLGAFLAYETRELKILSLNDTFWTGIAIYCVVTLSVVSAPLSFILSNTPQISYAVIGALTWTAVTLTVLVIFVPKLVALRSTLGEKTDPDYRTDDEIYEEEVDEETKLRHKIDEVDRKIELVKKEINIRTSYGRQGIKRGCGLWCFGHFFGCNCGHLSSEVAEILASTRGEEDDSGEIRALSYDNKGLQVSDWHLDEASPVITLGAAAATAGEAASLGNGVAHSAPPESDSRDASDITVAVEAYHDPPNYSTAVAEKASRSAFTATKGKAGSTPSADDDKDSDADDRPGKETQGVCESPRAPPIGMKGQNATSDWIPGEHDGEDIESTMM
ncbi:gamma-aminobutyric acid type B receptor subunit 1-like [Acanthaster planci]|uniref:Gamma-aminobutyric acid type B receptor subunit 2 n=1 Tax=Acanthaster planci TaxID=133434 RepID=A0A8B7Z9D8_ACAPL|nr:gamma-aminobutyric acid type B receptor subunit 1-like [Acanthaster planci]